MKIEYGTRGYRRRARPIGLAQRRWLERAGGVGLYGLVRRQPKNYRDHRICKSLVARGLLTQVGIEYDITEKGILEAASWNTRLEKK